ncbi:MAG: class III signal peptide-containing protein [Candidatus Diapherotrites archaeon]|nr:class III signal peptide-containing protein [Candidatus Diapherotrites archaeon]
MKKAQGSLEFLLMLGGVMMVAVIVISVVVGIATTSEKEVSETGFDLFCSRKAPDSCCGQQVTLEGNSRWCKVDQYNQCKAEAAGAPQTTISGCCNDGSKNQNETDIESSTKECGGVCSFLPTPQKCANGKACNSGSDCTSGNCVNELCAA